MKGVKMLDEATSNDAQGRDYVEFVAAGASAVGEYQCTACGYGVAVHATLPRCPMCSGTSWEQSAWSPLSRAARLQ